MRERFKELLRELFWGFGKPKSPFQRRVRIASRTICGIALLYLLFLLNPQLVFSHSVTHKNYTLHAFEPLPPETLEVLQRADRLLQRSDIFNRNDHHHIYLCNSSSWFRAYFLRPSDCVYAFAYPTGQIFIGNASIERDLGWKSCSTNRVRSLSGLIAHEVTHNLIRDRLGQYLAFRLPTWKNEGYAEYVAMHGREKYETDLVANLPAALEPNGMSKLYRGYLERVLQVFESGPATFSVLVETKE